MQQIIQSRATAAAVGTVIHWKVFTPHHNPMIILSKFPSISHPSGLHLRHRLRLSQGFYHPIPYPLSPSPDPKFTSNPAPGLRARRHFTNKPYIVASIPARDRVIDFGKYRGKMLGSLPSSYLQWISKNLRACDFKEWSKLADEVLEDPVYRDRIEWEFAEGVLNGNKALRTESAVSELLEISERFGWDNQDKVGWSRVNFELLGTSKGGPIPRRVPATQSDRRDHKDLLGRAGRERGHGLGTKGELALSEDEKRRRERRERLRQKRWDRHGYAVTGLRGRSGEDLEDGSSDSDSLSRTVAEDVYNPFPGRDGLLKEVIDLNRKRLL